MKLKPFVVSQSAQDISGNAIECRTNYHVTMKRAGKKDPFQPAEEDIKLSSFAFTFWVFLYISKNNQIVDSNGIH